MTIEEVERLNPQFKWNWRKTKKMIRNLSAELKRKGYFEDCYSRPCKITKLNPYYGDWPRHCIYDADVEGECLVEPGGSSCGLFSCGPLPLTESEAKEREKFYREFGEKDYYKRYV